MPRITHVIKTKKTRLAGHVARTGETIEAYKTTVIQRYSYEERQRYDSRSVVVSAVGTL
jgi:hypothetical protein